MRGFYTGRWDLAVEIEDIGKHLKSLEIDTKEIEELKTVHSRFKSFKFVCDIKNIKTILDSNNWPEGVTVKKWWEKRTSGGNEQGNQINSQKEVNNSEVNNGGKQTQTTSVGNQNNMES